LIKGLMVSGDVYTVTESGLELRVDPAAAPKAPSTPQEFLEGFRCVNWRTTPAETEQMRR